MFMPDKSILPKFGLFSMHRSVCSYPEPLPARMAQHAEALIVWACGPRARCTEVELKDFISRIGEVATARV